MCRDRFPRRTRFSARAKLVASEHVLNQPGEHGFVHRREPYETRVQTLQLRFRHRVEIDTGRFYDRLRALQPAQEDLSCARVCDRPLPQATLDFGIGRRAIPRTPGTAWAEAYALMVSTTMGLPAEPWGVVDQSFYPSSLALTDAQKDALDPWSPLDTATHTFAGRLTRRHPTATARVDTPLDGNMSVQLFSPSGARLTVVDGSGAIIRTATASFSHTICGERSLRIRISGPVGKRYRIVVRSPYAF
jgi:hypothetical protein